MRRVRVVSRGAGEARWVFNIYIILVIYDWCAQAGVLLSLFGAAGLLVRANWYIMQHTLFWESWQQIASVSLTESLVRSIRLSCGWEVVLLRALDLLIALILFTLYGITDEDFTFSRVRTFGRRATGFAWFVNRE